MFVSRPPKRNRFEYQPSWSIQLLTALTVILVICVFGWWWLRSYLSIGLNTVKPGTIVEVTPDTVVDATPSPTPSTKKRSPSPSPVAQNRPLAYRLEVVAENLFVPWRLVFTSPDRILVTERNGAIRVIENGTLKTEPILKLPVTSVSESGLMGMILDPFYEKNKLLYVCYTYDHGDGLANRVIRLEDTGASLKEIGTVIENIPAAQYHDGCELAFGPDDRLYITTGDATNKDNAQDPFSLSGKILRLNSNGTNPIDNPVKDSPIFSWGHRNPQGLAWDPRSGQLWSTEHGPSGNDGPGGGDEINAIVAGGNFGWPLVSHDRSQAGLLSPAVVFTPAVAPASAHFYTGEMFPEWKNQLFFGALRGAGLFRVEVATNPAAVIRYEKLPHIEVGRVRAVTEGPDGALYFTTSNRDGRGMKNSGDDKIYKLVRE